MNVCASSVSRQGSLFLACRQLPSPCVLPWQRGRDRLYSGSTLMTSFTLNYSLQALSPNIVTLWGQGFHTEFWGNTVQCITHPYGLHLRYLGTIYSQGCFTAPSSFPNLQDFQSVILLTSLHFLVLHSFRKSSSSCPSFLNTPLQAPVRQHTTSVLPLYLTHPPLDYKWPEEYFQQKQQQWWWWWW